jgi:hypothetical protein
MVSIKTIANGLSKQIEQAIEGKANVEQADILCKSVDSLVKLARLQIEMGQIDWNDSDERPVIEMEKSEKGGDPEKEKILRPESDQTLTGISFEQALKRSFAGCKQPLTIADAEYRMKQAFPEILKVKETMVGQTVTYWASKGHLEKTGTGTFATYKITDKEFFK